MEIEGKIKLIGGEIVVSEKFKKRDFVIITGEQYPQHISMQLTQERCGLLASYKVGDEIKCHINIKGREWTSPQNEVKHFNTIECWKVEGIKWDTGTNAKGEPIAKETPPVQDDLPF